MRTLAITFCANRTGRYRIRLTVIIVLALLSSRDAAAQTVAMDSISHEKILIGRVERTAFQDSSWYKENYDLYTPRPKLVAQIDTYGVHDSVCIVFGSWCSDSHMWVPMFLRVVDSTILAQHVAFIAVPRSAGWRDQLTPGLNIEKVPTFIFYRDGKEIGRIVEEPEGDLSDSIVKILKGNNSTEIH
jgi:hypothetical protein